MHVQFANGAIGSFEATRFAPGRKNYNYFEIYGSKGSLQVPDPNGFGGPVRVRTSNDGQWQDVPLTHGYAENVRGIGVADMAKAIMNACICTRPWKRQEYVCVTPVA